MGLVGCNDDDSPVGESILNIKSADLDFTAVGGEGSIIVDGYGTISAASDKDWCTVSVDGMTIHVTVAESQEITSRTALITISTGTDSREVPVVQSGALATLGNEPTLHVLVMTVVLSSIPLNRMWAIRWKFLRMLRVGFLM